VKLLGPIVKLQVQRSSLKVAAPVGKRYDTGPLVPVPALRLTTAGVVGIPADGAAIVDVHNRVHPQTKQNQRGINAVSVGFTSHYQAMRDRFGERLADGIAGENLLVQVRDRERIDADALAQGLAIETGDGARVYLHSISVAEPCLEFTRFALGYTETDRTDPPVTEGLRFLRAGTRGFYASFAGPDTVLRAGDRLFCLEPGDQP